MEQPDKPKRSCSKLRGLTVNERMTRVLPRTGLATEAQLEYLASVYPMGGAEAMQALLNLQSYGIQDCVVWSRESWHGDSISALTGVEDDKIDLLDPVPLPPVAGRSLMNTEMCLEAIISQLRLSLQHITHEIATATIGVQMTAATKEPMLTFAESAPRQVCMVVQRARCTYDVERCMRANKNLGVLQKSYADISRKLGDRMLARGIGDGERQTLSVLQVLLHEQQHAMGILMEAKTQEEMWPIWYDMVRYYQDKEEKRMDIRINDKELVVGNEYSPPTCAMLITSHFTHNLRSAYISVMAIEENIGRLLVLCGPPCSGKTSMLWDIGQMLGLLPTVIRATEQSPAEDSWWRRKFYAAAETSGGRLAPFVVAQAHRLSAEALEVVMNTAEECDVALCLTMEPCAAVDKLRENLVDGSSYFIVSEPDLAAIASGRLVAEGLQQCAAIAEPLGNLLDGLRRQCSRQPHYDFGPRTLNQLCTQVGIDRRPGLDEWQLVGSVVQRCVLPKLVKADAPILQRLLAECLRSERHLVSASDSPDGRWVAVSENIHSITKVEPDCIVLPLPESDEPAFFEEFCKSLNKLGHGLLRMPGKLSEMTPEELLGTMPKKGQPVKDGRLVSLLRKAMDSCEDNAMTWVACNTGRCPAEIWESLYELLNDSGQLNLATGEQIRLPSNLRFLFVMDEAGETTVDTFSRTAVVCTDP